MPHDKHESHKQWTIVRVQCIKCGREITLDCIICDFDFVFLGVELHALEQLRLLTVILLLNLILSQKLKVVNSQLQYVLKQLKNVNGKKISSCNFNFRISVFALLYFFIDWSKRLYSREQLRLNLVSFGKDLLKRCFCNSPVLFSHIITTPLSHFCIKTCFYFVIRYVNNKNNVDISCLISAGSKYFHFWMKP